MPAVAPTQTTISSTGSEGIRWLGIAWAGLLAVLMLLVPAVPAGADEGGARSGRSDGAVPAGGEDGASTGGLAPIAAASGPGPGAVGSPPVDPVPAAPSGIEAPPVPFVPDGGLGWGIVLALCGGASVGFVVRHATLRGAIRDAQRSALHDPLTGLANRRLFDEIVVRELARSNRRGAPIALVLMDLDDFKQVNDSAGHAAGDVVLRAVAETIEGRVRSSDLAVRLGGDEFAVVLPDCGPTDARRLAEDLRTQVSEVVGPAVTASVGVAVAPDHGRDADALLAASDAALYRAKAAGRNRVRMGEAGTAPTRGLHPSTARGGIVR